MEVSQPLKYLCYHSCVVWVLPGGYLWAELFQTSGEFASNLFQLWNVNFATVITLPDGCGRQVYGFSVAWFFLCV